MEKTEVRIAVVGLGVMGSGILQRLAERGISATGVTRNAGRIEGLRKAIERGARMGARLKRTEKETAAAGLEALEFTDSLAALAGCGLAIEAGPEDAEIKSSLLRRMGEALPPESTAATNTSSLGVGELAVESSLGARLVGMHFMNPVPQSQLVELIRHGESEEAHMERARELAGRMGLAAVEMADAPGFAVNRMLMPLVAEAARLVESGAAEAEAADTAMRLGCGHPLGPLALADMIGLDVVLRELEELSARLGSRFEPPEILKTLVAEGKLGRKSGRGFHGYGK
jgi:3-hydroxybutyryl-CoA dehydrogenase